MPPPRGHVHEHAATTGASNASPTLRSICWPKGTYNTVGHAAFSHRVNMPPGRAPQPSFLLPKGAFPRATDTLDSSSILFLSYNLRLTNLHLSLPLARLMLLTVAPSLGPPSESTLTCHASDPDRPPRMVCNPARDRAA